MFPRYMKIDRLNVGALSSLNVKYRQFDSLYRSLTIHFGHFALKHLMKHHFVMALSMVSQRPILRLVRHIYKKRLKFTSIIVATIGGLNRWFLFEQLIFKVFAGIDIFRTYKQKRRLSTTLDIKLRYSFSNFDTRPFYEPAYLDEVFLPFDLKFNLHHGRKRLGYRDVTSYMRMLKFPILLFRHIKPAIQHEDNIFVIPYLRQ
jgi:hypothetical protein